MKKKNNAKDLPSKNILLKSSRTEKFPLITSTKSNEKSKKKLEVIIFFKLKKFKIFKA